MLGRFSTAVAALLLAVSVASAGDRKDLQVLKDISSAVNGYSQFTVFDDVNASVNDGVVTLTGKVTMPYKRDDIEKRVAKIDGVRQVHDTITVLPVSTFDEQLRARIARAIYGNPNFWNYAAMVNPPIHIIVENSRVTLTGVVQSDVDRMLARSLATQFGALSVTNNLKTDAEVRALLEKSEWLSVPLEAGAATTALVYAADQPAAALILAHGAGAGQQHPFMGRFARALAARHIDIITFNFLYIAQGRRLPDRGPALEACYRTVVKIAGDRVESARRGLFIGGKSMGGRIATQIAAADAALPIRGLVLLGYPLHPPGRPEQRRDRHLPAIARPMLFIQGSRDAFGTPAELTPVLSRLMPMPVIHTVEGGDHSFALARKDAARQDAVFDDVQRTIAAWISGVSGTSIP